MQEADSKIDELSDLPGLRWHLIGHLQRNKARRAVERFAVIHSIDTLELARTVARHADEMGRRVEAFAQVNVSGEASKSGFSPEEFRQRADALARLPGLRWRGLMTMAPEEADTASLRAIFAATRSLAAEARQVFGDGWGALSMGMTGDFETAIEEGATHVRIGRAIFGERTAALQDGKP